MNITSDTAAATPQVVTRTHRAARSSSCAAGSTASTYETSVQYREPHREGAQGQEEHERGHRHPEHERRRVVALPGAAERHGPGPHDEDEERRRHLHLARHEAAQRHGRPPRRRMAVHQVELDRRPRVLLVPEQDRDEPQRHDRGRHVGLRPAQPAATSGRRRQVQQRRNGQQDRGVLRDQAQRAQEARQIPEAGPLVADRQVDERRARRPAHEQRRVGQRERPHEAEGGREVEQEDGLPGRDRIARQAREEAPEDPRRRRQAQDGRQVHREQPVAENGRSRRESGTRRGGMIEVAERGVTRPRPVVRLVVEQRQERRQREPRGDEGEDRDLPAAGV